jgi:type II pantothenate kinase
MIEFCGVDVGLTDTKYAYRKDGNIICSYDKPDGDFDFGFTGIKASDGFNEFDCITAGAREMTGLRDFLLVSMGTGTAYLRVRGESYSHLGGTGVGGGTIKGLYSLYGSNASVKEIAAISETGDSCKTDLKIGDISDDIGSLLSKDITVSNLFKLSKDTEREDFAAGIINLTAEVLIMLAVFAGHNGETIVCVGGLSQLDRIKNTAKILGEMHKISFIFPDNAAFAGAIGCLIEKENLRRIS